MPWIEGVVCTVLLGLACGGARKQVDDCASLPKDWRYERIDLPPEFAPTMPKGVEHLYFAPGMFEPESDGYWTYAFLFELDEPAQDTAALTNLLQEYYDGLVAAVSKQTNKGSPSVSLKLFPPSDNIRRGSL